MCATDQIAMWQTTINGCSSSNAANCKAVMSETNASAFVFTRMIPVRITPPLQEVRRSIFRPWSVFAQAEKLAGFKPTMDTRTLVAELQEEQRTQETAIEMLAGTRHVVVYYEDVVSDPGVSPRLVDFVSSFRMQTAWYISFGLARDSVGSSFNSGFVFEILNASCCKLLW
jgi:hypothetical protein